MKSNRVLRAGGIVLLAAFATGTLAQASPLIRAQLSPEPVSFLIVGLVLAVLPMIRKKRS
jgi:hypothetical protein